MRRPQLVAFVSRLFASIFLLLSASALSATHAQTRAAINDNTLSPLEKEIFNELNLARTRPAEYASYLEQLRPRFKGKMYQAPGHPALQTEEGLTALEEAIRFMRAAPALPPFQISKGMCMGAMEHVRDQGPKGGTGHKGSDGSLCDERVARFGSWRDDIGENLSYGTDTARERVLTLIIDDGVANRGHRNRILSRSYKVAGVSCGSHSQLNTMCVITFAADFTEKVAGNSPAKGKPSGAKPAANQTLRKF